MHKPGLDATVGEHSNFKKIPTHTQDHGDASQREGRVLPTYPRRPKRKRYDNTTDVVVHLHDRPILVPKVRHLRNLHTFSSVMSHELTIQQSVEGELRQHDGVMMVMMKLPAQGFA